MQKYLILICLILLFFFNIINGQPIKPYGHGSIGRVAALGDSLYLDYSHVQVSDTIYVGGESYLIGNTGIGTTTPRLKLDVAGGIRGTGAASSVLTGSIDPTASTAVVGVGTLFLTEINVGDQLDVNGEIRTVVAIADNLNLTVGTAFTNTPNDTSPDRIPAVVTYRNASNTLLYNLNQSGHGYYPTRLGIGTTAPAHMLDVAGNIQIGSTNSLYFGSTSYYVYYAGMRGPSLSFTGVLEQDMPFKTFNVTRMTITSAGKIGIGTTSPSAQLHIDTNGGTDGTGVRFSNASVTTTDATPTTIFTLATTTDKSYRIIADIITTQDDGSNVMSGSGVFILKNVSGTVTEVFESFLEDIDDSAGVSVTGTVSGTSYLIQVTGIAAETWYWEVSTTNTVTAH